MSALTYDELEGSPSFTMDREGGSARRVIKVAWADIGRAILEVFPGALFGYPYSASVPGFPWLRAQKMSIDPWNPEHMTGNGEDMNTYPAGAKITVDYAPNKYPDNEATGQEDTPQGADSDIQDVTFLEQKINFGGEYLTWPNSGVKWEKDEQGNSSYGSAGGGVDKDGNTVGDRRFQVFDDINVGVVIPTIEHTMTWNHVRFPPWVGIRSCIGKVNKDVHMNCQPETLLFNGCSAERTYSTQGSPNWKLEYRISEKCYNYPLLNERGLSNPGVWNGGTGYTVNDLLTVIGGVGGGSVIRVTSVAVGGIITGGLIYSSGSWSTIPANPFRVIGGTGRNATFTDPFGTPKVTVPHGWNHFLRPNTGRFEKMLRKDGKNIYEGANFRQLYGGRP